MRKGLKNGLTGGKKLSMPKKQCFSREDFMREWYPEIMNAVDFFMPEYQVGDLTIRGLARAVREKMYEDHNISFTEADLINIFVDEF